MFKYNGIPFEKLSWLLKYYDDPTNGIPITSGIYYWVYYPEFDPNLISNSDLIQLLETYSKKLLRHKEELKGTYKFIAEIKEQGFRELFGLSPSKGALLKNFLSLNISNKGLFKTFFTELCFSRPFYIGKANNLRDRLSNKHFKRIDSTLLSDIDDEAIDYTDIWIGHKAIPILSTGNHLNVIFEEILSRTIKPGLTKKPN